MLETVGCSGGEIGRLRRAGVARDQVVAVAADQLVVALAAGDEVQAAAAVDAVVERPAEQAVVAVAAADVERPDQRALLEVPARDAPLRFGVGKEEPGIAVHFVVAGARVDDGLLHIARLVEDELLIEDAGIGVAHEFLVGDVPDLAGELVAVEDGVEADGDEVVDRPSETVEVAAQELDLVPAGPAVEEVGQGRDQRALAAVDEQACAAGPG